MLEVVLDDYTLLLGERMPDADEPSCAHALLVERFDAAPSIALGQPSALNELHVEVRRDATWPAWPILCVTQRYWHEGGGDPAGGFKTPLTI
jgi:hypothetical protein